MPSKVSIAPALFLLLGSASAAPADEELGRRIVTEGTAEGVIACATCHGTDGAGNPDSAFPRLSILEPDYLAKQIRDYASGARQSPIMEPFAKALSQEQTKAASQYYAAQTTGDTQETAAAEPRPLGKQLALEGDWDKEVPACVSCHGPGGKGVGAVFPALAGQHASYIKAQLEAWKNGTRRNDPNDLMKVVADRLTDEEVQAVSEYFATLPGGY